MYKLKHIAMTSENYTHNIMRYLIGVMKKLHCLQCMINCPSNLFFMRELLLATP